MEIPISKPWNYGLVVWALNSGFLIYLSYPMPYKTLQATLKAHMLPSTRGKSREHTIGARVTTFTDIVQIALKLPPRHGGWPSPA